MNVDSQAENADSIFPRAATTIWIALIAVLTVGGSLAFACAAPLAAIAALAGSKMERASGLALVGAAWLSNQIVGYAMLGYPQTADSFAWGSAIGVASLLAFLAARMAASSLSHRQLGLVASFGAAFGAYELALYFAGVLFSGSSEAFCAPIVERIFEINAVSFVGLLILHRLALATSLLPPRPMQIAT